MKLQQTIGFLGTGNMAEALIKGLRAAEVVDQCRLSRFADGTSEREDMILG